MKDVVLAAAVRPPTTKAPVMSLMWYGFRKNTASLLWYGPLASIG